jgi:hypothetical protein
MRRLHAALGAGALFLAVAACAEPKPTVGFGGQPPAPPPGPVAPAPVQERVPVPDSRIDYSQLPQDYPHTVWTQEGGTVVVATGQEGGCTRVHAQAADQSSQQVTVVLVAQTPEPPGFCTQDLRYVPVAVQLAAPLGERKIVLEKRDVKVHR